MDINYRDKVRSLETTNVGEFENVVTTIHFQRRGIDTNLSTSVFIGVHKLDVDIDSGSFIQYDNLQESDILDWLYEQKVPEFWTRVNNRIENDIINSYVTKTEKFELPWQVQE